jgi:hypothetical protein
MQGVAEFSEPLALKRGASETEHPPAPPPSALTVKRVRLDPEPIDAPGAVAMANEGEALEYPAPGSLETEVCMAAIVCSVRAPGSLETEVCMAAWSVRAPCTL